MANMANMANMASPDSSVPPPGALESVSATDAKNNFGAVLDKVLTHGKVAISKQHDPLSTLSQEFDGLVERMQKPAARAAGRALFKATPRELGQAAVTRARRRER
jgi:hypothetical protein